MCQCTFETITIELRRFAICPDDVMTRFPALQMCHGKDAMRSDLPRMIERDARLKNYQRKQLDGQRGHKTNRRIVSTRTRTRQDC